MSNVKVYPFREGFQIERFLSQFIRVMSGFQCRNGVDRNGDGGELKRVPVVYSTLDRVVASITSNSKKTLVSASLPRLAVSLAGIEVDVQNRRNHYYQDTVTTHKAGINNDGKLAYGVSRTVAPALILTVNTSILASSNSQLYQILEQILLVFNPRVTISDGVDGWNSDYLTEISLESLSPEISDHNGFVEMGLVFSMPVRLHYPIDKNAPIIELIKSNLHTAASDDGSIVSQLYSSDEVTGDE